MWYLRFILKPVNKVPLSTPRLFCSQKIRELNKRFPCSLLSNDLNILNKTTNILWRSDKRILIKSHTRWRYSDIFCYLQLLPAKPRRLAWSKNRIPLNCISFQNIQEILIFWTWYAANDAIMVPKYGTLFVGLSLCVEQTRLITSNLWHTMNPFFLFHC